MNCRILQNAVSGKSIFSHVKKFSNFSPVSLHFREFIPKSEPGGPTIVVSHGMLGSSANWVSVCKKLCDNAKQRVIAVDARNHGQSPHLDYHNYDEMSSDLQTIIQKHCDGGPVTLLGHSMGGRTSMLLALSNPDLVKNLIVVDISPFDDGENDEAGHNLILEALSKVKILERQSLPECRKDASSQLANLGVADQFIRQWLLMNLVERKGSVGWCTNIKAIKKSFQSGELKFPTIKPFSSYVGKTLFIGGSESQYIRKDSEDKIRTIFPNSEFRFIPGAGHWVHAQKPNEFLTEVLKFLETTNF